MIGKLATTPEYKFVAYVHTYVHKVACLSRSAHNALHTSHASRGRVSSCLRNERGFRGVIVSPRQPRRGAVVVPVLLLHLARAVQERGELQELLAEGEGTQQQREVFDFGARDQPQ